MNDPISTTLVIAFIVGVIATSRFTRLVVDDDWPPIVWLREKYIMSVPGNWAELAMCCAVDSTAQLSHRMGL